MTVSISKLWAAHEFVSDLGALILGVDKVGGGTTGKEYTGAWVVNVYDVNGAWLEHIPVRTGMPHTHRWVANFVREGIADEA